MEGCGVDCGSSDVSAPSEGGRRQNRGTHREKRFVERRRGHDLYVSESVMCEASEVKGGWYLGVVEV